MNKNTTVNPTQVQRTLVQRTLDAQGLYCPEPVMMLHNVIREIAEGDVVKVLATDPSTQRDIPKFCQFLGHELLEHEAQGEGAQLCFVYLVRKTASSD